MYWFCTDLLYNKWECVLKECVLSIDENVFKAIFNFDLIYISNNDNWYFLFETT